MKKLKQFLTRFFDGLLSEILLVAFIFVLIFILVSVGTFVFTGNIIKAATAGFTAALLVLVFIYG